MNFSVHVQYILYSFLAETIPRQAFGSRQALSQMSDRDLHLMNTCLSHFFHLAQDLRESWAENEKTDRERKEKAKKPPKNACILHF